jgi:uncharacterized protein (TIGR03118 family)
MLALTLGMAPPLRADNSAYEQKNLVSDEPGVAANTDPNLVNAWGIAFNPNALVWVANAGTRTSTLYDGAGKPATLVVKIPDGNPTGIVFNGSGDFVTGGNPSRFIFATESGTLAAWAPSPSLPPTTTAVTVRDNSTGAIYKGLALAANGAGHFLYATDFHNNKIDVFDKGFTPVTLSGSFADPTLPPGFAPFGIQNLNGDLYVTYARQDADREDDVAGPGRGFVNVFDADGHLIRRIASRGRLNAPWGLALAPASFGKFGNHLLVGNFGDGKINAYDVATGSPFKFRGQLQQANNRPIQIDGLWGLSFGNGILSQPTNALFFTAGPGDPVTGPETHGLYGRIDVVAGNDHASNNAVEDDSENGMGNDSGDY